MGPPPAAAISATATATATAATAAAAVAAAAPTSAASGVEPSTVRIVEGGDDEGTACKNEDTRRSRSRREVATSMRTTTAMRRAGVQAGSGRLLHRKGGSRQGACSRRGTGHALECAAMEGSCRHPIG